MGTIAVLMLCWLIPSVCCFAAACVWGTPEAVIGGTLVGGVVAVFVGISILI
jgi:hypothetical protein